MKKYVKYKIDKTRKQLNANNFLQTSARREIKSDLFFWLAEKKKRIWWKLEGIDPSLPPRKAINPSTMMRMLIPDLFIQQRPASCATLQP